MDFHPNYDLSEGDQMQVEMLSERVAERIRQLRAKESTLDALCLISPFLGREETMKLAKRIGGNRKKTKLPSYD